MLPQVRTDESGWVRAAEVAAAWHAAADQVAAETGTSGWLSEDLACPDCPAEVRVTEGAKIRARVIHSATCPWHRAYQAGGPRGRIPCGVVVTHRGPYKRDPERTR